MKSKHGEISALDDQVLHVNAPMYKLLEICVFVYSHMNKGSSAYCTYTHIGIQPLLLNTELILS